ncbi:MAG: 3-isopropylmalate dehydrogenase [Actinobacteria bacterium]|nr:3-isopropylmalate dehydrogenase [Actinomycetota bacterium]
MREFKVAILPGDGIGPEITKEAVKVLNAVSELFNVKFNFIEADIGGVAIDKYQEPLPEETRKVCLESDAVLLAAVGGPKWDSTKPGAKRPEDGLLELRKLLNTYANLRPVKVYEELIASSPLKPEVVSGTDLLIVRELTGGIYFGNKGREKDFAFDTNLYTVSEIERCVRLAFRLSKLRRRKVTLVDKANVLETSRLWREVFLDISKEFDDVETEILLVDNAAMQLIRRPSTFDVIVTENMFGDILSDEAATISGSIGLLASASIGESHPYLYEPIHGSAPDIAGKGLANPLAMILSSALMLRYSFNLFDAADAIENAVEKVIQNGYRTPDIATKADKAVVGTQEMSNLVIEFLYEDFKKN